ncbi:MAG: hypothetical protein ACJ76T_07615 [Solirubrobacteraceae bacterium]
MRVRLALLGVAVSVCLLALPVSAAFAGRVLVTGHDTDLHCGEQKADQCHFFKVATDYVRNGSTKPVLVLDPNPAASNDVANSLINAYNPDGTNPGAVPPSVLMDPKSAEFASAPITTDLYSAIIVASDITCGGCDLNTFDATPDSDAINARSGDIANFFNAGGGIFANAGADHGDGNPATGEDTYYSFIPLPIGGVEVTSPFTLTDAGIALGLQDSLHGIGTSNDINCCPTHNSFTFPPSGSALTVAELNGAEPPFPETLFAEGVISGGGIVPTPPPSSPATTTTTTTPSTTTTAPPVSPPPPPAPVTTAAATVRAAVAGVPRSGCTSSRFVMRVRVRGTATRVGVRVEIDGRVVARSTRKSFTVSINAKRLKPGRHRVTVVARGTNARSSTTSVTFRRCAAIRPTLTG